MLRLVYCSSLCVAHSQLLVLVYMVEAILPGCTEAENIAEMVQVCFLY